MLFGICCWKQTLYCRGLEGWKVPGTAQEQNPVWPWKAPSSAQQTWAGCSSPGNAAELKPRKAPERAAQEQPPALRPAKESSTRTSRDRWSRFGGSAGNYLQGHALEPESHFPRSADASLAVCSEAASHCQRQPRGKTKTPVGFRQSSKLEGGSTRNIHASPIRNQPTTLCSPQQHPTKCRSHRASPALGPQREPCSARWGLDFSPAPPAPTQQSSQPPDALPQEYRQGLIPPLSLFLAQNPPTGHSSGRIRGKPAVIVSVASPWVGCRDMHHV